MKFLRFSVLMTCIFLSANSFAESNTLLVLDARDNANFPRNFRTTSSPPKLNIDTRGLKNLHAIGSAEFSKRELEKVLQHLQPSKLLLIDLREESHGFLNGSAISWYGPQNATNAGKSPQEVEQRQAQLLENIKHKHQIITYTIGKKNADGEIVSTRANEFRVRNVFSEAKLAQQLKLNYKRIYVQDRRAPRPEQVDRFLQAVKNLPADEWIYFHCRAGIGRTTTFMAMFDMLHNAKQLSFNDVLLRQVAIGGKTLAELPRSTSFKYKFAVERLEFLKKFYQYAREDSSLIWSEWLAQHNN